MSTRENYLVERIGDYYECDLEIDVIFGGFFRIANMNKRALDLSVCLLDDQFPVDEGAECKYDGEAVEIWGTDRIVSGFTLDFFVVFTQEVIMNLQQGITKISSEFIQEWALQVDKKKGMRVCLEPKQ